MSKKICFVVQRYGLEVNGGAELLCRQLAEHMLLKYNDIHVLTSKAIDYTTWKDEYTADEENINGVWVHRFGVEQERNQDEFNQINAQFMAGNLLASREEEWVYKQGPALPKMIEYIKDNHDTYDVFILVTYLYYPVVMSIEHVADKAIIIPNAHDEPFLKMSIYDSLFKKPRAFFFNTEEEQEFIRKRYQNESIPSLLGGVGVEVPKVVDGDNFKQKYQVENYIIYVGRIDEGKNCPEMFDYFKRYKQTHTNDLKLVTIGKAFIDVEDSEDVINLGFLPEDQDKFDGIKGAKLLWLPSIFESLSMVVLEAMSVGTPVIVNGKCPVLKGHCERSNGAFYYNNYEEFEREVDFLLDNNSQVDAMRRNARKYVDENFQWDVICQRLASLIETI